MPETQSISDHDIELLTNLGMDYAEGWYTGDEERMRRALHPTLVKRTIIKDKQSNAWAMNGSSSTEMMMEWTAEGGGSAWSGALEFRVDVLDVFRDIALVKCVSPEYVDYLQAARMGAEGWKIVHVLWQLREGDFDPTVT